MSRIKRGLFSLSLLLCSTTPGCIAIYGHRPVQVEVRDVETGEPISGARVEVVYFPSFVVLNPPHGTKTETNSKGMATLKVAEHSLVWMIASAHGYETLLIENFREAPANKVVFNLYHEPRPKNTVSCQPPTPPGGLP